MAWAGFDVERATEQDNAFLHPKQAEPSRAAAGVVVRIEAATVVLDDG